VEHVLDLCRGLAIPARDTGSAIRRAGFTHVDCEDFDVPITLIGPHIAGVATR
jgi:hypothetical protein